MEFLPSEQLLSALISLLVGGLLGREIFRILDKPNVVIQYRKITRFHQSDGVYLSMRVGNIGRSAAERCVCTLSIFDLKPDQIIDPNDAEVYENLPEYREENIDLEFPRYQIIQSDSFHDVTSEKLCWSELGNPAALDINPGTAQNMDICKLFRGNNRHYFIFPSEVGWRRVRIRISASNRIRGRLLVCPANDFPTPLDFELYMGESEDPVFRRIPLGFSGKIKHILSKRSLYTK